MVWKEKKVNGMTEEIRYIPFELAKKLVGAVMEEEHIHEPGRRVLTVYDINDKEICWYDADEIMEEMAQSEGGIPKGKDEMKARAVELILHQIPAWAVEDLLVKLDGGK